MYGWPFRHLHIGAEIREGSWAKSKRGKSGERRKYKKENLYESEIAGAAHAQEKTRRRGGVFVAIEIGVRLHIVQIEVAIALDREAKPAT